VTNMNVIKNLLVRFNMALEHHRKQHEERDKHNRKMYELRQEFHRSHEELNKELHEKLRRQHPELNRYHRHIKYSRPIILIISLAIWYLVFRYVGFKVISVFFAVIISVGGITELLFLWRLEKRIFNPIGKLRNGVEEIAKGNYNVKVESDVTSGVGSLIDSFNEMAQKLQESEKMKSEYEENRKTLIANISHDLKTPITSIQGYIEAIIDGNTISPENINKYLQVIYSNTAYINKLIDDLFLFSKLDMQKLDFQFVNIQVRPFINDLMEEFKFEFEEKQFDFLYIDKMENDCNVNIDRKRLHQVFRNIIGNAVRYGPERGLSIKTDLYRQDDFVCIDIKDNGPGIHGDKIHHIFDRFYRIDTERTKDFMGSGLGLAIAKELVEAHGGRILVSSVEKEGTCFTVMLPILPKEEVCQ